VDKAPKAKARRHRCAVVDGEYTIKRLYQSRGRIELQPENPSYQPITFSEGNRIADLGCSDWRGAQV
jgi:DNA polymerase V